MKVYAFMHLVDYWFNFSMENTTHKISKLVKEDKPEISSNFTTKLILK